MDKAILNKNLRDCISFPFSNKFSEEASKTKNFNFVPEG